MIPRRTATAPRLRPPVPQTLVVERFRVGDGEYAVISFELASAAMARLSPAERAVVDALLEGHSNREIAARRGAALRTVANQLASAYRKVGVRSRVELAFIASVVGLVGGATPPRGNR